jgi:RNA polymerase sigma-70 factor, ECF subfamily
MGDVPVSLRNDSFQAVVLPHLGAAHSLARWLMRDDGAAKDVLQDTMVRALTYFASFKGINPRRWLLQIVRNVAYDLIKLSGDTELVLSANNGGKVRVQSPICRRGMNEPETSLIKSRDRCHVRQLIAALPAELRETLVLRELEELSYKEIAEVTQTSIGTVMSRLWRARQMLVRVAAAHKG